jgi:molybdenum cofactor guanylyltransferase
MGRDKASLPFGPQETLLQRIVRRLAECVPIERVVCVAAAGQVLPALPKETQIVFDRIPNLGPLAGLATGFRALNERAEVAFVCGCDTPLLQRAFVMRMFDVLGSFEIAAPHDGERWHPLSGVYRTNLIDRIEKILAKGERSLQAMLESRNTRRVSLEELREVDNELLSIAGCNTPEEYVAALRAAGELPGASSC